MPWISSRQTELILRNYLRVSWLGGPSWIGTVIAILICKENKRPLMKYLLCSVLSLVLLGCGGGSPLTLNQDNLNKIHDDMSQAEVRSIMGSPSESKEEPIPIVGGTQTTYTYRNDRSEVVIVFKNDQVKEKHGTFGK